VLALLFVVYVINFVDRQILAILLQPIKQDLGVSDTAMGFRQRPAHPAAGPAGDPLFAGPFRLRQPVVGSALPHGGAHAARRSSREMTALSIARGG